MAVKNKRDVSIVFTAVDNLTNNVKGMESSLSGFGGSVSSAIAPLGDLSDAVLKVEGVLAGLAIGGMALAVTQAGKFGDSFAEISTLIDASASDIKGFKSDVLAYAQTSTQSIEDINKATYSAISSGVKWTESLGFLSTAEKLAVAGVAELEPTTRLLASTLNAYGESADKAGYYSDVFFTIVKDGQVQLPELAQGLAKVTQVAAATETPISEVGAALAALTGSGAPTSEALTQIKAVLGNILKPSAEATKLSKELGLAFDVQALKSKGLAKFLDDATNATGGNEAQMGKLFGSVEAVGAVFTLTGVAANKFKQALDDIRDSAGATEEAYRKMAEKFAIINQTLINNVRKVLIDTGDRIEDDYKGIVKGLTEIFKGVSIALDDGAFKEIFDALDGLSEDLEAALLVIAKNIPEALKGLDFSELLKSLDGLGDAVKAAFEAIFGTVDLQTAAGLTDALQRVVNAITSLQQITTGIVQGLTPFFSMLGEAVSKFEDMDGATSRAVGSVLGFAKGLGELINVLSFLGPALAIFSISNMLSIIKNVASLSKGIGALTESLTLLKAASILGGAALAGFAGYAVGNKLREWFPSLDKATQSVYGLVDSLAGFEGGTAAAEKRLVSATEKAEEAAEQYKKMRAAIEKIPTVVTTEIKILATGDDAKEIEFLLTGGEIATVEVGYEWAKGFDWDSVTRPRDVDVEIKPDYGPEKGLEDFFRKDTINKDVSITTVGDGFKRFEDLAGPTTAVIEPELDDEKTKKAKQKLEDAFKLKTIEINSQFDIEKIKAQAETAQKALELTATVNISQIEAAQNAMKGITDVLNTGIQSSGDLLSQLFDQISGAEEGLDKWKLESALDEQNDRQERLLQLQEKLTDAQVRLMRAKADALEAGNPIITVNGEGIEPELEIIMFKILERVQVRVNESYQDLLLGLNA